VAAPSRWSEKVRFSRPPSAVRLAGSSTGLTQEEIHAYLRDRHRREELARLAEEDRRFARQVLEEVRGALASLREDVARRLEEWRPFLVELALKVAERVLHAALDRGDYDLSPLVAHLLERARNASTGGGITVAVNPADLSSLVERLSTGGGAAMDPDVRFEASGDLPRGSCRITTEEGRLTFDPEEFLKTVSDAVREELLHDEASPGQAG